LNEFFSINNTMASCEQSIQDVAICGLDIGGTKMAATVATASGPVARVVQATVKSGTPDALAMQALALLNEVCKSAKVDPGQISALGIGSCGPFVKRDGFIELVSPNLCGGLSQASDLPNDWTAIPLGNVLSKHFPKVIIENDCVTALCAERAFGSLQNESHCAYVTWSTGIGFGFAVDGNVLRGKNGNAGHAGHMLLSETSTAECGCGNVGDVEALISGRNLQSQFGRSTEDIFAAAKSGEPQAHAIARQSAIWLGRALFNITATLDISTFAIGGSVWQHHGDWLRPLVLHEITSRLPALTNGVKIINPGLQSHVVDGGALYLAMPEEWIAEWRANNYLSLLDQLTASTPT
jgi:glucokinase